MRTVNFREELPRWSDYSNKHLQEQQQVVLKGRARLNELYEAHGSSCDTTGHNLLTAACANGLSWAISQLAGKIGVNHRDANDLTPLGACIRFDGPCNPSDHMTSSLLAADVATSLNTTFNDPEIGWTTPLIRAMTYQNYMLFSLFLNNARIVDFLQVDYKGTTPLMLCWICSTVWSILSATHAQLQREYQQVDLYGNSRVPVLMLAYIHQVDYTGASAVARLSSLCKDRPEVINSLRTQIEFYKDEIKTMHQAWETEKTLLSGAHSRVGGSK